MKRILIIGLLLLALVAVPLFATACEEEELPPAQQEEEEEEEEVVENWWDEFGEPQYGGTITIRTATFLSNIDTYNFIGGDYNFWYEALFVKDWKLDRKIWQFTSDFVPDEYWTGNLAESWELGADGQTITVHLRHGVKWQDKPPVNGREFTAYDVQHHYDRILGTGSGFTEPAPMYIRLVPNWERVTATDDYTVVFKFKTPSVTAFQTITDNVALNTFEAPEYVEQGDLQNWQNAVGTGPWILTDVVEGTSMTYSKNPNYWGYDERYPKNQLPYADTLEVLVIPDQATAMSALRTGQIDLMTGLTWQQAESLADTNPDLQQAKLPSNGAYGMMPRMDKIPFTDIRVRKALNMAIDRQSIAENYYGGTANDTAFGVITQSYEGYCFPYADWPQTLKDEYSYNPTKAKQLLAEAAADGVFEPNDLGGFDTNALASNSYDIQLAQVIQEMFMDIGVNVEITTVDFPQYHALMDALEYDQMLYGLAGGFTTPPASTIGMLTSASNKFGISDPAYDAIVDEALASTDPAQFRQLVQEADAYAIQQHWRIATCIFYNFNIWQPYFKGYSGETCGWGMGLIFARLWKD